MRFEVKLSHGVEKRIRKCPQDVQASLVALIEDLRADGPEQPAWPNYSKLDPLRHHCHLRKGRPTYVAVWEIRKDEIRMIEVTYVGTHEKAPY